MTYSNAKTRRTMIGQSLGLGVVAHFAFHVVSVFLFAVLGLAPSSPNWNFVWIVGGTLAIAGSALGLQTFKLSCRLHWLAGIASGAASGAILGFYSSGLLSGRQSQWAIWGALAGSVLLGALAGWANGKSSRYSAPGAGQRFCRMAIALASAFCTYGVAFGLGAWVFAAMDAQRWGLGTLLGLLSGLYLWITRRSLEWIYRQWRWGTLPVE